MEKYQLIERSIITTYRKKIWAKFVKAVKDYKLINENNEITGKQTFCYFLFTKKIFCAMIKTEKNKKRSKNCER